MESESTSEVEDHTKTWGSARGLADDASSAHPGGDCGIGHRMVARRSVLALVVDEECVFAGLQEGDIVVSELHSSCLLSFREFSSVELAGSDLLKAWSLETYDLILSVYAHKESVLSLFLSEDGSLLFSSGGDSVVNVS